jgi:hypothetical protein
MTNLFRMLLLFLISGHPSAAGFESVRTQEISECRSNELLTWGDGQDRPVANLPLVFAYDPALAPDWFPPNLVAGMVHKAADAWSPCGVPSQVVRFAAQQAGTIRVQWRERESRGNFALANLSQRTLSLSPKAFELLKQKNPAHDARETLQMVISHEMGHFFGLLAHSRRCVDVLSYYNNGKGEQCFSRDAAQMRFVTEYRHIFPTACDIERCRKVNGKPPLPAGRLGIPAPRP